MGNGMVDRFNQTLINMLDTLENHKKEDWASNIAPLVHSYNATKHPSTGFAPYFLMFGRYPRLAIDAYFQEHRVPTEPLPWSFEVGKLFLTERPVEELSVKRETLLSSLWPCDREIEEIPLETLVI